MLVNQYHQLNYACEQHGCAAPPARPALYQHKPAWNSPIPWNPRWFMLGFSVGQLFQYRVIFNHATLTSNLTGFILYVDCPTRENKMLDLLYAKSKGACIALPQLGKSDHNLVFLQPTYKPCLRTLPDRTNTFRKWTMEANESLTDSFECTKWNVLLVPQENSRYININRMVGSITDYIHFCWDIVGLLVTLKHSSFRKSRHLGKERGRRSGVFSMSWRKVLICTTKESREEVAV